MSIFADKRSYQRFLDTLNYYQYEEAPVKFSSFLTMNKDDRKKVERSLMETSKRRVEIIAYCLMPNHFHLLLRQTGEEGISELIRRVGISYGRYFNLRRERLGPLLQGAFKAVRITSEEQLIHVIRYIHINPYVGFVTKKEQLTEYQWSSLGDYMGNDGSVFIVKESLVSLGNKHLKWVMDEADYKRKLKEMEVLRLE